MYKQRRSTMLLLFFIGLSTLTQATEINTTPLPAFHARADQTSISGMSSGAFMATQFHVAYSKMLIGAGIVAGGPWNCAASNATVLPFLNAVTTCMNPCKHAMGQCQRDLFPNAAYLSYLAKIKAASGDIDSPLYLHNDQVYIFSGTQDKTVVPGVVDATAAFYKALGVSPEHIRYRHDIPAGHAFLTTRTQQHHPCAITEPPYINACEIALAEKILSHMYGALKPSAKRLTGQLLRFDQTEFIPRPGTSMDTFGFAYIPASCQTMQCRIHVALHGCEQGASVVGTTYVTQTGYLEAADTNQIIMLFPQVKKSPLNPHGCWDFWGYTDFNLPPYTYYSKRAPQMITIKRMILRLIDAPVNHQQCVMHSNVAPKRCKNQSHARLKRHGATASETTFLWKSSSWKPFLWKKKEMLSHLPFPLNPSII